MLREGSTKLINQQMQPNSGPTDIPIEIGMTFEKVITNVQSTIRHSYSHSLQDQSSRNLRDSEAS